MSLIKAVFYSPLSAVAIVLFFTTIVFGPEIYALSMIALTVYLIALIGIMIIGIPTHLILNKLHIKNGIAYLLIGFLTPIIAT